MHVKDYSQMIGWLTRDKTTDVPGSMAHEARIMDQAALSDDVVPGPLKDEMLGKFNPDQETYEEYLQRINLERPFNMAEGGQLVAPSVDGSRPGYSGQGRSHWIYEPGSKNKKLKKEVIKDITTMMADSKNFPDKQTITKTFKYSGNPDKVLKMWAAQTGNTVPEERFRLHTYEGTDIQKKLVKAFEAQGDNPNIMKLAREFFPEMYKKKKTGATQQVRRILTEFADYVPRPNEPVPPGGEGYWKRRRKKINLALKRMGDTTIGEQMANQIWEENQKWVKLADENPNAILKNKKLRDALTITVDVDTGEIKKRNLTDDEILERVKRGDLFTEDHITEVREVETAPKKGGGTKLIKGHAVEYPTNKQSVTTFWNQSFLPNAKKYIAANPDGKNVKDIVKILDDYGLKLQVGDKSYGSTVEKVAWNSKTNLSPRLKSNFDVFDSSQNFLKNIPKGERGFLSRELAEGVARGAGKGIRIAGKWFGIPDAIFYYIDKQNMISKGIPEKEAAAQALKNSTFGLKKNKEYMKGLKKTAESMGIDARAFDDIYKLNVAGQKFDKYYVKAKEEIENLKELGYDKKADDAQKNLDRYMKEQNENLTNLNQKVIDQVSISKAGGAASPLQLSKARDVITQEDYYKPFEDITKVAKEKLKREKRKAFPTQKRQVDTAAGEWGEGFYKAFDHLTQGAKNVLQGRIIPYGPERFRPLESERQKEARYLKEMEPRELYLHNKAKGYTYDQPITSADIEDLRYNQPGVFYSEGGIASLKKKW